MYDEWNEEEYETVAPKRYEVVALPKVISDAGPVQGQRGRGDLSCGHRQKVIC